PPRPTTPAPSRRITPPAPCSRSPYKQLRQAAPPLPPTPTPSSNSKCSSNRIIYVMSWSLEQRGTRGARCIASLRGTIAPYLDQNEVKRERARGFCRAGEYLSAKVAAAPPHLFRFARGAFARPGRDLRHHSDSRLQRRDGPGRQAHHGVRHHRAGNRRGHCAGDQRRFGRGKFSRRVRGRGSAADGGGARRSAPQAECPACAEKIKPGVAVCRSCGAILDREKAAQFGLIPTEQTGPAKSPQ